MPERPADGGDHSVPAISTQDVRSTRTGSAGEVAVQVTGVTKRFPGVLANDAVDLEVRRGEIHALLGENGAGKSTLMNVLCGLYHPDEGQISIRGADGLQPVDIRSPRHAIDLGIGMVHQHFKLVKNLTVTENVVIGMRGVPFRLDLAELGRQVAAMGERYHIPVDPDATVWQLSVGEQQRVEILKILHRGAEVLILDEPTAVLTPQESDELGRTLRSMVAEGKAIIFISHKLDEVMDFADQVTVLRQGRKVATLEVDNTTKGELARLMVGRELQAPLARTGAAPGPVLLRLDGVEARDDRGSLGLKGIDLEVRAGEILGIAGVAGNGQQYLAEVVAGLRPMSAGRVEVRGRNRTGATPREMIAAGVVHVPSDRLGMGLAPNMSLAENLAIRSYRKPPLARGPFLDRRRMAAAAVELIERFNVSTPGPATPARNLSGGNQQKAILAREITAGHATAEGAVIVAADPTRGLDVGAVEAVRSHLAAASRRGSAVLLISEDLDDLLVMADRIAVFHRGEVMGVVTPSETSVEELGLLMAGERRS